MKLKYAVIGTGAVGGYYGGRLAQSGKDIHFLFRSDYEHVKKNGLRVDSIAGDFILNPVKAYNKASDMPQCDVILVCLKSTNNHLLKELLPPLLHQNTVVLLIQNGLELEADIQRDFPTLDIAGGLAFICSNKVGEGHIKHLDFGGLNIGSHSCKDPQILDAVCEDFKDSSIMANVVELCTARWMKLVWNIPFNGLTVALNTTTEYLMENASTRELMHAMMLEVIQAANTLGYSIDKSYADKMMKMTQSMAPYSPSMKIDLDYRKPLEIHYIYSSPLQQALEAGCDMPRVSMLEKQLRFIESQYNKR